MKFRKRPVVIEAEHFDGIPPITKDGPQRMFMEWPIELDEKGPFLIIPTLEGSHRADIGDWIITGVKGEKYPIKPDIFEATYEKVEDRGG